MARLGQGCLIYTSPKTGITYAIRPDGKRLHNSGFGWKLDPNFKLKPNLTLKQAEEILRQKGHLIGVRGPSFECLQRWEFDGIAEALDGCQVEPDGTCEHGYPSWLLARGLI